MTESDARKHFGEGLVGSWASYLGGGNDMLIGMKMVFRENGSGTMEEWGFDQQQLDPAYVSVPEFRWRSVGDRTIEITHRGETRRVNYDFSTSRNEYGIVELRVFEVGRQPGEHGEIGFWICPFSLVYRVQNEESAGLFRRFWTRLKR